MKSNYKAKEKCKCMPHGTCLRCMEMQLKAHNEGYDHAINDLKLFLSGKKPTARFRDVVDRVYSPFIKFVRYGALK